MVIEHEASAQIEQREAESGFFSPKKVGCCAWTELCITDLDAARRFYTEQFGWALGDVIPMGDYQFIEQGGRTIGAMFAPPGRELTWRYCFRDNLERSIEAVRSGSSEVLFDPAEVPGGGHIIQATDHARCILYTHRRRSTMTDKLVTCLWFDKGEGRKAAEFYASVFPDSHVGPAHEAASDYPGGEQGDELMVEFTVLGRPFVGLNGGPNFKANEAVSFMVLTDTQEETDRYWDAITQNGGQESACGWCKDRWGFSWQITPRRLLKLTSGGGERAKRAFEAMMQMRKIDIAALERAVEGAPVDA